MSGFCGSFLPEDVTFLLKQVPVSTMAPRQKERYIQREGGHYSQVLSEERAPTAEYLSLFDRQAEKMAPRVAQDVLSISRQIHARIPQGPLTPVSLARAGTPVGVLVHRTLQALGRQSQHYCVSIFRDKGLDLNALDYIRQRHADNSVVFIDGWTGKGVVGAQLARSIAAYNEDRGAMVNAALHVLADISGTAAYRATREDYLLPSAILNGPVSGLISRTVLNEHVGATDFHGCTVLPHLREVDRSRWFVDTVWSQVMRQIQAPSAGCEQQSEPGVRGDLLQLAIARYMRGHGLKDINLVKPGVGESTRVLLRRVPLLLALQDPRDPYVEHLLCLAREKQVPVVEDPTLPCRALALIASPD